MCICMCIYIYIYINRERERERERDRDHMYNTYYQYYNILWILPGVPTRRRMRSSAHCLTPVRFRDVMLLLCCISAEVNIHSDCYYVSAEAHIRNGYDVGPSQYVYIYICIYIYTQIYMYIYIYIYVYDIYIYIRMYI